MSETRKFLRKIRIVGRPDPKGIFAGTDIRYFNAETGAAMPEVQSIGIGISIDDAVLFGEMLWIDFDATPAPDEVFVEVKEMVEIVAIDIQTEL